MSGKYADLRGTAPDSMLIVLAGLCERLKDALEERERLASSLQDKGQALVRYRFLHATASKRRPSRYTRASEIVRRI